MGVVVNKVKDLAVKLAEEDEKEDPGDSNEGSRMPRCPRKPFGPRIDDEPQMPGD